MTNVPRHHRQMLLPGIGAAGQDRLARSHVLVAGCGALGSVAIDQLARAGVGTLSLVDRDVVEETNLQRQTLYVDADARSSAPKASAAAARVRAIDPAIRVHGIVEHIGVSNVLELLRGVDLVVDGLDNLPTRYLLNDACVKLGIPLIYGGAVGTGGMSMSIVPGHTACLRCVFPEAPPPGVSETCDTAGVLAAAVATVASHQVAQAIKCLLSDEPLAPALDRALVSWDLWENDCRRMDLSNARNPACPCCVEHEFRFLESHTEEQATTLCGRNSVQIVPSGNSDSSGCIDLAGLSKRLASHGQFEVVAGVLKGRIDGLESEEGNAIELTVFPDGRAIVGGTIEPEFARSVYARFVGQ